LRKRKSRALETPGRKGNQKLTRKVSPKTHSIVKLENDDPLARQKQLGREQFLRERETDDPPKDSEDERSQRCWAYLSASDPTYIRRCEEESPRGCGGDILNFAKVRFCRLHHREFLNYLRLRDDDGSDVVRRVQ
jgi:hypothetical protein